MYIALFSCPKYCLARKKATIKDSHHIPPYKWRKYFPFSWTDRLVVVDLFLRLKYNFGFLTYFLIQFGPLIFKKFNSIPYFVYVDPSWSFWLMSQ